MSRNYDECVKCHQGLPCDEEHTLRGRIGPRRLHLSDIEKAIETVRKSQPTITVPFLKTGEEEYWITPDGWIISARGGD